MAETLNGKVYANVKVDFGDDGLMCPREITWADGTRYEIDRVIDIRQAPAVKAGGQGDQYKVQVHGQRRYLFFERSTNQTGSNLGDGLWRGEFLLYEINKMEK